MNLLLHYLQKHEYNYLLHQYNLMENYLGNLIEFLMIQLIHYQHILHKMGNNHKVQHDDVEYLFEYQL